GEHRLNVLVRRHLSLSCGPRFRATPALMPSRRHDLNDISTFVNDVDTAPIVTYSSPVWSATLSGFGRLRRWRTCPRPQSFIGERGTIPFRPQRLTLLRGPFST